MTTMTLKNIHFENDGSRFIFDKDKDDLIQPITLFYDSSLFKFEDLQSRNGVYPLIDNTSIITGKLYIMRDNFDYLLQVRNQLMKGDFTNCIINIEANNYDDINNPIYGNKIDSSGQPIPIMITQFDSEGNAIQATDSEGLPKFQDDGLTPIYVQVQDKNSDNTLKFEQELKGYAQITINTNIITYDLVIGILIWQTVLR